MGMFDELICERDGFDKTEVFQTKDTPTQQLDMYQIRGDGTLWFHDYDIENRSAPNAEGVMVLAGCMSHTNKRWRRVDGFTGEIYFYGDSGEFSAYYINGELQSLVRVEA